MTSFDVKWKITPNPETRKFIISPAIFSHSQTYTFTSVQQSQKYSLLAFKLFNFPWVQEVLIGKNFLSLTKKSWIEWIDIQDSLCIFIQEHLNKGLPIVEEALFQEEEKAPSCKNEVERKIEEFLYQDIRPALQMDGGDLTFIKLEDDIVHIKFRGACSHCPSSHVTLNQGIKKTLQELFPQVKDVLVESSNP